MADGFDPRCVIAGRDLAAIQRDGQAAAAVLLFERAGDHPIARDSQPPHGNRSTTTPAVCQERHAASSARIAPRATLLVQGFRVTARRGKSSNKENFYGLRETRSDKSIEGHPGIPIA